MSSFPRRSARLSSQQLSPDPFAQRGGNLSAPAYANNFSQPSSTSTTSHPSPISDAMHPPPPPSTPLQPQHRLQIQPHFAALQQQGQSHLNAPLPSPSGGETAPFFGRPNSQPNPYTSQQLHPGFQTHQGYGDQNPQMSQQGQQYHSGSLPTDHTAQSMAPGQLPPDFLAEAAKRAQMACLMRDMGDVSL
jgi:hypothetical protein